MKSRVHDIRKVGDKLFSDRRSLDSLWQEIALQFYVERADFTMSRNIGDDFSAHLMTGAPSLIRRDLANNLSSMLRPRGQPWFYARTKDETINEDQQAKRYMDWMSDTLRSIMYDRDAMFVRATKEGDNDFATFGQTVITVELRKDRKGLIYRCWHLRDVAWIENDEQKIDSIHHNWAITATDMVKRYGEKASSKVRDCLDKDPFRKFKCRRVVMPSDEYDLTYGKGQKKHPFVVILVDCENEVILEERPLKRTGYVIPRWQTVSGSQYAHSPATVIALPDARLLQQINLTLLEAGQKAVDPPMLATREAIAGGVNTYPGAVTWVDAEYDERLGEALRPMNIEASGLNWGVDREERITQLIEKAFFLDQLGLPDLSGEKMTAYETRIRLEEYTRRALPLFEPMESEYNGALCDLTFEMALDEGAFGPIQDMPQALKGQEIEFQFESPIQAASKRANAQVFQQSAQLLAIAAQIDPNAVHDFDVRTAFRQALDGTGAPAEWIVPKEYADQLVAQAQEEQAMQAEIEQALGSIGAAGQAGESVGNAMQALQGGMMPEGMPA